MADESALTAQATGIGLVLGVGIASTVAVLFDGSLASMAGYGAGAGLVVGAMTGQLAGANRGAARLPVRVVGGSVVVGLLVSGAIGLVGAWSLDASLPVGLAVGAATGVVHGGIVGGLVVTRVDGGGLTQPSPSGGGSTTNTRWHVRRPWTPSRAPIRPLQPC